MEGHSYVQLGYREARLVLKLLNHAKLGDMVPRPGEMTMQTAETMRAKLEGFAGICEDGLVRVAE